MNIYEEGKRKLSRLLAWRESREYQSLCLKHQADCRRLVRIGQEHLESIRRSDISHPAERLEYAINGDMHRGFYCPSPVLDLIIGNIHRGRILKRVTARSKITHRYGLDAENNLVYAEALEDGEVLSTEYLFTRDNCRMGVTVLSNGDLAAISEEIFENQKLARYSYLSVYPDHDGYFCANLHVETYEYDELGLCSCKREDFQPYVNVLDIHRYDFTRKDGNLFAFTAKDFPLEETDPRQADSLVYLVKAKRKA